MPYDYFTDQPAHFVGLTRTASLISQARSEVPNSILVDNGDFLQGSPLADYVAQVRGANDTRLHPMISAMNQLRYDAGALGNHEFNYGIDFLLRAIKQANFPVLSANAVLRKAESPNDDSTLVAPYVLLDRKLTDAEGQSHPIRIGIIACLPPQTENWDAANLQGRVKTREIVETIQAYVPIMRAQGADLVIVLSHSGVGTVDSADSNEQVSLRVAAVEGVDVIVCGHTHQVFPSPAFDGREGVDVPRGTLLGKPTVMPGSFGSHLGVIDLELSCCGGQWAIRGQQTATRAIARFDQSGQITPLVTDDPNLRETALRDHLETLTYLRQPIGRTTQPIHSFFAQVGNEPSVQLVTRAQEWYARNHLIKTEYGQLPLLSAAAPAKTGGRSGAGNYIDIPAGALALRNIAHVYPFPNHLAFVLATGSEVRDWLEHSASNFLTICAGARDQPLVDQDFPSYNFDVIDGITYEIDLSAPARFDPKGRVAAAKSNRVKNLKHNGRAILQSDLFVVVTNSFRSSGAGWCKFAEDAKRINCGHISVRDVILQYLRANPEYTPDTRSIWRFSPMDDTSVLFHSAPAAQQHLSDPHYRNISFVGPAETGFATYSLEL